MDENEMLNFVKAIADTDRLRIIGLLTQKSARLFEICGVLGFHPADAQHHLDQLLQNGVVGLNEDIYELNAESLENYHAGNSKANDQLILRNWIWKRTGAGSWLHT